MATLHLATLHFIGSCHDTHNNWSTSYVDRNNYLLIRINYEKSLPQWWCKHNRLENKVIRNQITQNLATLFVAKCLLASSLFIIKSACWNVSAAGAKTLWSDTTRHIYPWRRLIYSQQLCDGSESRNRKNDLLHNAFNIFWVLYEDYRDRLYVLWNITVMFCVTQWSLA